MPATYSAILRDGQLEWDGDAPPIPAGTRVQVTVAEPAAGPPANAALAALERIAAAGGPEAFGFDIEEWERDRRADRPLPGRDE